MQTNIALLVDDDDDFRRLFSEVLHEEGYSVVEASNGVEAISALDRIRPDVILIDLVMPHMDGRALFAWLRKRPDFRAVPVVFLTAVPTLAPIGASMTIAKPLGLSNLTRLLDAIRLSSKPEPERRRDEN